MESITLAALFVAIVIVTLTKLYYNNRGWRWWWVHGHGQQHGIPTPPGAWPIIGHLPLLAGKTPPHRSLAALSDQWGPVFSIRLGMKPVVIVSGVEAAKEWFTSNDQALASRPKSSLGKHMGHDYSMFAFAPCGSYWRHMRKLAMVELLSSLKVEQFGPLRVSEVGDFIRELYTSTSDREATVVINMGKWFRHLIINIITKMMAGKRYAYTRGEGEHDPEAQRMIEVITEFTEVAGLLVVSDFVPIPMLEWLDLQGNIRAMKRASMKLDPIVESWIDEHRQRKIAGHTQQRGGGDDFIDALLSQEENGAFKFDQFTNEHVVTATVEVIFIAATDTTSITLTWVLSLLMNHPQVLNRAHEELDQVVGLDRWVEESDIRNLIHLQAIVKETLRLYPPGPLAIPHEATQDCSLSGYPIQKGTQLLVNLWKLQRDPQVWANPDDFNPWKFLSGPLADADIGSGNHFELIPFGSGRRKCPGSETALQIVHLTIARLLQGFTLSTPDGKPVDMKEGPGFTLPKAAPLELVLTPRLSHVMYN